MVEDAGDARSGAARVAVGGGTVVVEDLLGGALLAGGGFLSTALPAAGAGFVAATEEVGLSLSAAGFGAAGEREGRTCQLGARDSHDI